MADTILTWAQGEDLILRYLYQEGNTADTLVTINLATGYAVRMDIVVPASKQRIYTFNSADIADVDPIAVGAQPDTLKEATLSSGAGGTANVAIKVPRSLTLPGGVVYTKMIDPTPVLSFRYDVFLRNTTTDEQIKIDKGIINVEESYTLWL